AGGGPDARARRARRGGGAQAGGKERPPAGRPRPPGGQRPAANVAEDVVERAADLEEAGEDVGRVLARRKGAVRNGQEALEIAGERVVERHPPVGGTAPLGQAQEVLLMAAVSDGNDPGIADRQILRRDASTGRDPAP